MLSGIFTVMMLNGSKMLILLSQIINRGSSIDLHKKNKNVLAVVRSNDGVVYSKNVCVISL